MMMQIQTPSTVVVPAGRICPRCGAPLGGFGPEGLCGACLFDAGLTADEPVAELDLLTTGSRRFGDYELLEEIARGGMGVIFKARHLSLNRVVAVKMILRGEFASVADLARFRAEAETAARLQHPNIVAIHEVGEREGLPYFSMDYIEGQNLAQLVGNTPQPAARAAKYLRTIAEAVQYAHEQGVLHRDLKPSNVLIDSSDQPRVTDFGLAKRLPDPVGTRSTASQTGAGKIGDAVERIPTQDLTITGQILGSPNFMPPEQAAGNNAAIGPASDVYSLGAMLYHALTGRPPFVAESVTATLRLVAETEPVSPRLLVPTVPRDLETICLKCLQKEPQRRYGSAQEFADELNRFLRDEPIQARPVSQGERFWRWCRRKPALASSLFLILILILIVSIGSPIAVFRINNARHQAEADKKRAQTEASKSWQVAEFLKDMLKSVGPSVALGRDTTMLREVLDKTAQQVGEDLKDEPVVEAELRNTLGEVYYAIGEVTKAEVMHRAALELRRKLSGSENMSVAASQHNLGRALYAQNEGPEAETMLREALATRKKLLGKENLTVAESLNSLCLELAEHNQSAEAETLFREALAIRRKLLPSVHLDLAVSLNNLAKTLSEEGKNAEAEGLSHEALDMQRKLLGNEHPDVAISLCTLATALIRQGKFSQAELFLREGLAMQRKLLGREHPDMARSLWKLAEVLLDEGRNAEAETAQREALAMLQKIYGSDHQAVDWPRFTLAIILQKAGNSAEAEALFRETLVVGEKKTGADRWLLISALNNLADLLRNQGRLAEAEPLYRQALAIVSKLPSSDDPRVSVASCWSCYGVIYTLLHQGKLVEAESVFHEAMASKAQMWLDQPGTLELSVTILVRRGKHLEAEQFLTNAPLQAVLDRSSSARRARGDLRARVGRWNEGAADFEKAVELEPVNVENYHWLAPLLVQSGQLEAYRECCRKAVGQFADTKSSSIAERLAKDCLILPASGVDLETVSKMADVAISAGTNHPGINWIRVTKGLAEYRQGRWASAVDWTEQALSTLGVKERDAEAYLVLAMAKYQLNQPDEARAALAKAVEITETKLPKLGGGDLGELWGDWIIAHVLLNEAKTLIEGNGSGSAGVLKAAK